MSLAKILTDAGFPSERVVRKNYAESKPDVTITGMPEFAIDSKSKSASAHWTEFHEDGPTRYLSEDFPHCFPVMATRLKGSQEFIFTINQRTFLFLLSLWPDNRHITTIEAHKKLALKEAKRKVKKSA